MVDLRLDPVAQSGQAGFDPAAVIAYFVAASAAAIVATFVVLAAVAAFGGVVS